MKLGVDLSMQEEMDALGTKYFYQDKEIEPFSFFAHHSHISSVRLRLWHNPYDEEGNPYGGGTNDLETFIRLAKRANKEGMSVLLDFHYSDFWTDPSRQFLPKAWKNYSFLEVIDAVYQYTRDVLIRSKEEGIDIVAIQVGNEISNGFIFPFGSIWNEETENGGGFASLAKLLQAGYKACKEIYPHAKRICHLEHAGSYDMQNHFFEELSKYDVDFDVIGESYYPYWHGAFPYFKENISKLKEKYHKEIWVVEMGYEHSESLLEDHHSENKDLDPVEFEVGNINGRVPFPITKEGQRDYLKFFLKTCLDLGIEMVYYWEPTWVLMENNGWAKDAGQRYVGLEPTPGQNDWANETLFDYSHHATPGIDVFTEDFVASLKENERK